jgi:hypothetical protein
MANVDALIWHDLDGNITAVGYVVGEDKKVEPLISDGRRVLKSSVEEEHLATLHLTHSVDVEKARLLARDYKAK